VGGLDRVINLRREPEIVGIYDQAVQLATSRCSFSQTASQRDCSRVPMILSL
jgi:hypothetical protein